MFALIIDILYLLVGLYLVFVGFTGRSIVIDNNISISDSKISHDKLFISQMIVGAIIALISGYKIYSLF